MLVSHDDYFMIHRDIEDAIDPWLGRDKIIILRGARQVGKTTILKSIKARLQERGEQVRYIAADLDFAEPAFGDPRLFLLRLGDLFAGSGGTVLIDEARWHRRSGSMLSIV